MKERSEVRSGVKERREVGSEVKEREVKEREREMEKKIVKRMRQRMMLREGDAFSIRLGYYSVKLLIILDSGRIIILPDQ